MAVSEGSTLSTRGAELSASPSGEASSSRKTSFWRFSIPIAAAFLALLVAASMLLSPLLAFAGVTYLGAILVVIMFPVFLIPKLWRLGSAASYRDIRLSYWLHAVRGAAIAATGLAFLLLPFDFASKPLFRLLVFAVPVLFFMIPAAGVAVSFLLRNHPDAGLFRGDPLVRRSRLLSEATWVTSGVLVAAVVWVFSFWPVSLRDGPDTVWANSGFEKTFGFTPPASVDDIYYRQFLFWQTNDIYAKFDYRDPAVVERIILSLDLERSQRPQTYAVIREHFPARWLDEDSGDSKISEFYTGRGHLAGRRSVWVDRERQILYYLAFH